MTRIKLGYAIICDKGVEDLIAKLDKILKQQIHAIEFSPTRVNGLEINITKSLIKRFKSFEYRSIHAPVKDNNSKYIYYPEHKSQKVLDKIDRFIQEIDPQVLVFHPDQIHDFNWLNKRYGSLLAFENMDKRKDFGKTIGDMKEVFEEAPKAKWVFDINHLYTNDKTMKSAQAF